MAEEERLEKLAAGNPLKLCGKCKCDFKERVPKLLPCLHTVCEACIANKNNGAPAPVAAVQSVEAESVTGDKSGKGGTVTDGGDSVAKDADQAKSPTSTRSASPLAADAPVPKDADGTTSETGDASITAVAQTAVEDGKIPPLDTVQASPKPSIVGDPECPVCSKKFEMKDVLDNLFIHRPEAEKTEAEADSTCQVHICTACDENQEGNSFCLDCEDWLCDQCVQAHKRVRITKDHTISSKEEALKKLSEKNSQSDSQRTMFCKLHKQEPLKLFCETCDKLTCRDCQLLEHKDHSYQFVKEAIHSQKAIMESYVSQLKAKLESLDKTKTMINEKDQAIKSKQKQVAEEIKGAAEQVTSRVVNWCKNLMQHLVNMCNTKLQRLNESRQSVTTMTTQTQHCLKFLEYALESGDELSLLYTKNIMVSNVEQKLKQNCEVTPHHYQLDVVYKNDVAFLSTNVNKLGCLEVNGVSFPGPLYPPSQNNQPQKQPTTTGSTQPISANFTGSMTDLSRYLPPHILTQLRYLPPEQRKEYLKNYALSQRQSTQHAQQKSVRPQIAQYQYKTPTPQTQPPRYPTAALYNTTLTTATQQNPFRNVSQNGMMDGASHRQPGFVLGAQQQETRNFGAPQQKQQQQTVKSSGVYFPASGMNNTQQQSYQQRQQPPSYVFGQQRIAPQQQQQAGNMHYVPAGGDTGQNMGNRLTGGTNTNPVMGGVIPTGVLPMLSVFNSDVSGSVCDTGAEYNYDDTGTEYNYEAPVAKRQMLDQSGWVVPHSDLSGVASPSVEETFVDLTGEEGGM